MLRISINEVVCTALGYAQKSIVKSPVPNPKSAFVFIFAASPTPSNCKLAEPNFLVVVFNFASPIACIVFPFCSAGNWNPNDFPLIKILSPSTAAIVPDANWLPCES